MEDLRIKYSPKKLKKTTVSLWVTTGVFLIFFLIVRVASAGHIGTVLYGISLGAALGSAFTALIFSLRLGDRFNQSASIAVICKDGIRITDEPYNFGLIRWELITGFIIKKTMLNLGAKYFIAPILLNPKAFLNGLSKKKRKIAKHGRRFGSPAAFDITNAELSPNELLALFIAQFEERRK